MTSKISFHKMCREYMRHHLAELLGVVLFMFLHVLYFVINMQNSLNTYHHNPSAAGRENMLAAIAKVARPGWFMIVFVGLLGALTGMLAFRYLHSRIQTDFYHSLPVKRTDLYRVTLLSVFMTFFLPLMAGLLIECLICAAAGAFTPEFMRMTGMELLVYLLVFNLCFLTESLAMILTGHLAVGFLGGCVFALYAPLLLRGVIITWSSMSFMTYTAEAGDSLLYLFSPLSLSLFMIHEDGAAFGLSMLYVIATILWIMVLLLLNGWLFAIRPSEMAGKAMAFPKIKRPLRFLMVIPMSLFFGWGLYQMTLLEHKVWLVLGILIGCLLFHGLVEAIYQMDIRGLWSGRWQFGLTVLLSLAVAGMFTFDIFGYDSYLPKEDQIKSVLVEDTSLYRDTGSPGDSEVNDLGLTGEEAKAFSSILARYIKSKDYDTKNDSEDTKYHSLTVTWYLKNGRVKERKYDISDEKYENDLNKLYAMEEFKSDNSILYHPDRCSIESADIDIFYPDIPYGFPPQSINQRDLEAFVECYRKDFSGLSYTEVSRTLPLGTLELSWKPKKGAGLAEDEMEADSGYYDSVRWTTYWIYPSFTNTLTWFSEHNYQNKDLKEYYKIAKLVVNIYDSDDQENGNGQSFTIEDPQLIASVKDRLVPDSLIPDTFRETASSTDNFKIDRNLSIEAYYQGRGGEEISVTMETDTETAKKLLEK